MNLQISGVVQFILITQRMNGTELRSEIHGKTKMVQTNRRLAQKNCLVM